MVVPRQGTQGAPRLFSLGVTEDAASGRAARPGGSAGVSPSPPNTRAIGSRAERRALWHYRLRGYRLLAANAWFGGYELDLVLRRGRTVVFCEVKAKGGPERGDPLEMVTAEKRRRIQRAAVAWLASHPELRECEVRMDVAAERTGKIERVANAF
jgi:putative endonuclease